MFPRKEGTSQAAVTISSLCTPPLIDPSAAGAGKAPSTEISLRKCHLPPAALLLFHLDIWHCTPQLGSTLTPLPWSTAHGTINPLIGVSQGQNSTFLVCKGAGACVLHLPVVWAVCLYMSPGPMRKSWSNPVRCIRLVHKMLGWRKAVNHLLHDQHFYRAGYASPLRLPGWGPGPHCVPVAPPQILLHVALQGPAHPHPPGVPQPPCSVPALSMVATCLGPAAEQIDLCSFPDSASRSCLSPRCRDTCSCRVPSLQGSNLGTRAQLRFSSFYGCLGSSAWLSSAPASSQQQHHPCPNPIRLYLCSRRHAGCSQCSRWC